MFRDKRIPPRIESLVCQRLRENLIAREIGIRPEDVPDVVIGVTERREIYDELNKFVNKFQYAYRGTFIWSTNLQGVMKDIELYGDNEIYLLYARHNEGWDHIVAVKEGRFVHDRYPEKTRRLDGYSTWWSEVLRPHMYPEQRSSTELVSPKVGCTEPFSYLGGM